MLLTLPNVLTPDQVRHARRLLDGEEEAENNGQPRHEDGSLQHYEVSADPALAICPAVTI